MPAATRWGIVGCGAISTDFVISLKCLPPTDHQVAAVAARDKGRAQEFAKKFDIPKAYGSYEEIAQDKTIDIIYVGVIHPYHYDVTKLLLNAGKNVLCEKPLTLSKRRSQELVNLAKEKNVFFMEAFWSRFSPAWQFVKQEISKGTIGNPIHINTEFGFHLSDAFQLERFSKKTAGAGGLVDLAPYTIGFALTMFGDDDPEQITVSAHMSEEGVDTSCGVILKFSKQRFAVLCTHTTLLSGNTAIVYGTKGKIEVKSPFYTSEEVVVNGKSHHFTLPEPAYKPNYVNTTGLCFEAQAVRECLLRGEKESSTVSHQYTLQVASIIDECKRQIGLSYDCD